MSTCECVTMHRFFIDQPAQEARAASNQVVVPC